MKSEIREAIEWIAIYVGSLLVSVLLFVGLAVALQRWVG